jgi:hypothetical protein
MLDPGSGLKPNADPQHCYFTICILPYLLSHILNIFRQHEDGSGDKDMDIKSENEEDSEWRPAAKKRRLAKGGGISLRRR